jgi:hypothetical protein
METIHLGFEVGTGEPIGIPLRHLIITGQTRLSGKTTTLDAIVHRSGLRALTFLTKPGEDTFAGAHRIRPYFHDQGGWRFTASVLEATMGEKLKMERPEIIAASKGTKSLREVYDRIVAKKEKARDGFVKSILTGLEAYLEIVLPQLERAPFASSLELGPGVNLIDMAGPDYSDELRALVIRSALEWILKHEKGVVTVIPEAWQFIPEGRGNPVKDGCTNLIRLGGVQKNWVWIDSQEVTAVDAGIRKSIGTWILGVQRELNEVKRVIDQLPGQPKPKPDEVMGLGLGQFFVSYSGAATRKVYAQPTWMGDGMARSIATGESPLPRPRVIQDGSYRVARSVIEIPGPESRPFVKEPEEEEDEMASEEVLQLLRSIDKKLDNTERPTRESLALREVGASKGDRIPGRLAPDLDEEALFERFKQRLLKEPAVLRVLARQPEIAVEVEKHTIAVEGKSLRGRIAQLIVRGFFDSGQTASSTRKELKRTGGDSPETNIARVFGEFTNMGFLTRDQKSYTAVQGMKTGIVERPYSAAAGQ